MENDDKLDDGSSSWDRGYRTTAVHQTGIKQDTASLASDDTGNRTWVMEDDAEDGWEEQGDHGSSD